MSKALNLAQFDLRLRQLSPTIGAEVEGIDLRQPLGVEQKNAIYQALVDYKVLFFHEQFITSEQHLAFARNFGELEVHPFIKQRSTHDEIVTLKHDRDNRGQENEWHSDVTWRQSPSLGSILRAIKLPDVGGDTLWADMTLAYENLSDEMKKRVEGLIAVHDFGFFAVAMRKRGVSEEKIKALEEEYPSVEHPVIRTMPDTGKKAIYVNRPFTRYIKGMDKDKSKELLEVLFRQAWVPEHQVRFRWREGSIAFWDNRSTQHYAVSDYWPNVRLMERATIIGERPY